jgi:hypothetical protein
MFKMLARPTTDPEAIKFMYWVNDSDDKSTYVGFIGKIIQWTEKTVTFDAGTVIFRYPKWQGPLERKIAQKPFVCECEKYDTAIFHDELYVLNVGVTKPVLKQELEHMFTKRDEETARQLEAYQKLQLQ